MAQTEDQELEARFNRV